jgi:hypothetical protein
MQSDQGFDVVFKFDINQINASNRPFWVKSCPNMGTFCVQMTLQSSRHSFWHVLCHGSHMSTSWYLSRHSLPIYLLQQQMLLVFLPPLAHLTLGMSSENYSLPVDLLTHSSDPSGQPNGFSPRLFDDQGFDWRPFLVDDEPSHPPSWASPLVPSASVSHRHTFC